MAATDIADEVGFSPLPDTQDQQPPPQSQPLADQVGFQALPEGQPQQPASEQQPSLADQAGFRPLQTDKPFDPGFFGVLAHAFATQYPGVAAATAVTGAAEPAIAAAAAATAPTIVGPAVVETVGNLAVWLGTYTLYNRVLEHGEKALAENSPTIKSYLDAVQSHPVANQLGQLAALGPDAATSIKGFYDLATSGKAVSDIAKTVAGKAAGAAVVGAGATVGQPALDYGINKLGAALGIPEQEIQKPKTRDYIQNIAISTLLSGKIKGAADEAVPKAGTEQPPAPQVPYFGGDPSQMPPALETMMPGFQGQPGAGGFTLQPQPPAPEMPGFRGQPGAPGLEGRGFTMPNVPALVPEPRPPISPAPPLEETLGNIPQPQGPPTTADLTRAAADRHGALVEEGQRLAVQAELSKAATGSVDPHTAAAQAANEQQLNAPPQMGGYPQAAPVVPSETAVYPPARVEAPPPTPVQEPTVTAPEEAAAKPVGRAAPEVPTIPAKAVEMRPQDTLPRSAAQTPDPAVSELANKFTEQRVADGKMGVVTPAGPTYNTQELLQRGLRMGPEQINQHISDLMNNRGGDPILQGAAVRANEARLRQVSDQASRFAQDNPGNKAAQVAKDNAFKDLTDWHDGPVAKVKNIFNQLGIGLQDSIPVDLSTHNGLREQWLKDNGQAPPPSADEKLNRMANKVNDAIQSDNGSRQKLSEAIDKTKSKLTADEVRQRVAERMDIEPCRI